MDAHARGGHGDGRTNRLGEFPTDNPVRPEELAATIYRALEIPINDPQDASSGLIGGDGSLPGFGIVNLRGGRRIGEGTTLYLGVENLTDRAYRIKDSRIDGPGINFVVGLDVTL